MADEYQAPSPAVYVVGQGSSSSLVPVTLPFIPRSNLASEHVDDGDNPTDLDLAKAEATIPARTKTLADLAPLDVECMLSTEPKPRRFLFTDSAGEGLIVAGTGAGIAGPGGAGKSTITLGFAYALAIGGVWLEQYLACKPERVYFFTAEESADEIHHRLTFLHRSYCQLHSITGRKADEIERLLITNLRLFTLLGALVELTSSNQQGGFRRGKAAEDAVQIVNEDAGAADSVMIFDPLRKLTAGNEDGAALTTVITTCDWVRENAFGTCTTVILQHSSQSAQQNSDDSQSAFRGATDLVDGLRWTMVIQRLLSGDAKSLGIPEGDRSKYRRYSFPKSNYSREMYGMYLEYSNGTYRHVELKSQTAESIEDKAERAIPILCKVLEHFEGLSSHPVSVNMIVQSCKAKPEGDEIGSLIPIGKNKDPVGILLLEAKKQGLVSSSQVAFPGNKKLGEAWKLTDAGRALLESDQ
jgi:regulatory protein RepA